MQGIPQVGALWGQGLGQQATPTSRVCVAGTGSGGSENLGEKASLMGSSGARVTVAYGR